MSAKSRVSDLQCPEARMLVQKGKTAQIAAVRSQFGAQLSHLTCAAKRVEGWLNIH